MDYYHQSLAQLNHQDNSRAFICMTGFWFLMGSNLYPRTERRTPRGNRSEPGGDLPSQGTVCHVYVPHRFETPTTATPFWYSREPELNTVKGIQATRITGSAPAVFTGPSLRSTVGIRRNSEAN